VLQGDILDVISSWPAAEQERAYRAIADIEEQVTCFFRHWLNPFNPHLQPMMCSNVACHLVCAPHRHS
jgi:hypothetical protein